MIKFVVQISFREWRQGSLLGKLGGLLANWRQGSWLLQWPDAIAAALISLAIAFAPFVSTSLIGILLLSGAIFWVILWISEPEKQPLTSIHLLVLLYWGISTVAVAFSPVKSAALSGWLKLTLYLIFFALAARVLRSAKLTSWIMAVFLLTSLIVSAYGIRQELIGVEPLATWNDPASILAQDTRVYSYLGNPNLLAAYLTPAIAFSTAALITWKTWPQKALALVMLSSNSTCLYFTDSRGGWLAFVVLLVTFFLGLRYWWQDYLSPFWRTWLVPVVFGTLALLIAIAAISVEPLRLRILSIFSWRGDSSNNFRINVWHAVLEMIGDRPLTGIGPGNEAFNLVYPNYMQTNYSALSAYSIFLEIAVETGLIGLFCFLWLLIATISQGIRQIVRLRLKNQGQGVWILAGIAAMAGMLTQGLVDTVWYRPQIITLWWLTVALIAANCNLDIRQDRST